MKIACISDVHIRSNTDEAMKTMVSFFNHEKVLNADQVYLLGDIFDHVAGSFEEYFEKYSEFFKGLEVLLKKDIQVFYVEGNHDVHLKKLFKKFVQKIGVDENFISTSQYGFSLKDGDNSIFLSHGDEYDHENKVYKLWKKFLISKPVELIIENLVSFKRLDDFSKKASDDSKARHKDRRDSESDIREKFRIGVLSRFKQGHDLVIGGHSHVMDHFSHDLEGHSYNYINNGYPQVHKKFSFIENGVGELVEL